MSTRPALPAWIANHPTFAQPSNLIASCFDMRPYLADQLESMIDARAEGLATDEAVRDSRHLLADLDDALELYQVAARFVEVTNSRPVCNEELDTRKTIERHEAWREAERNAHRDLSKACYSYARRHGVEGHPLEALREAAMNGWELPTGTRDRERTDAAILRSLQASGGAL